MPKQIFFPNWSPIRAALERAYVELGLQMVETAPGSRSYPDDHWNIAGLLYNHALADVKQDGTGLCRLCRRQLTYDTVIRCLDCRTELCESCAPAHFGPNHGTRAKQAHG